MVCVNNFWATFSKLTNMSKKEKSIGIKKIENDDTINEKENICQSNSLIFWHFPMAVIHAEPITLFRIIIV